MNPRKTPHFTRSTNNVFIYEHVHKKVAFLRGFFACIEQAGVRQARAKLHLVSIKKTVINATLWHSFVLAISLESELTCLETMQRTSSGIS